MTMYTFKQSDIEPGSLLIAMHSSSETLGIAIVDFRKSEKIRKSSTFSTGKNLSNKLLGYIDELLPRDEWSEISRIAVATGPGGFTTTRLTVAMARTLAQQLNCSLDGISSFALMAPRLVSLLSPEKQNEPFWITKDLYRRGKVGGHYQLKKAIPTVDGPTILELITPRLIKSEFEIEPELNAEVNVQEDVLQLLALCEKAHHERKKSPWNEIVPIYPTSPVGNL